MRVNKSMEAQFHFLNSLSIPWRKSDVAEGVEVKDLGAANGTSMQLVRFAPGTRFPVHTHVGPEFVYMIEGSATQNNQLLESGWASTAERGTVDDEFFSSEGCTFLTVFTE